MLAKERDHSPRRADNLTPPPALLALRKQSSVAWGVLLGLGVWLAAMLLSPLIAALHPLVGAGHTSNPGAFLLALGKGWTPALFSLLDHLRYGTLVGAIYKHRRAVAR